MRPEHWRAVLSIAGRQHDLVTSDQLRRIGVPPRTLRDAVDAGVLVTERRGVFAIGGRPASHHRPLLAACLAAGGDTVASHLAAAWLWDFPKVRPGAVEVTTFLARNRSLSGVRTHQTGRLLAADRTERAGIPVTCAARTAVDLGAVLTPYLLASFVDHLGRSGHLTIPVLANELEALGGRGRRGTRALQRIVADRREGLEAGDSDLEVRIVRTLVRLGVAAPVQGHQVTSGRRVFVLDLAWPDALVAVEVDGFAFHASRTAFDHDRERDLLLRQVGWEVIRVSSRTDLRMLARLLLQRGLVCEGPHTTPKWTRQASRVNGRGRGR